MLSVRFSLTENCLMSCVYPLLRLVFFTLFTLVVFAVAPAFSEKEKDWPSNTIIVGGDYNFPPYEYLDEFGEPSGYNVEITKAIAEVMGLDITIKLGGWDDMREALNRGEVNVLQGMTISEPRQRTISFSPPNVMVQQSIFSRNDAAEVHSLDDLFGKEVIVQHQGSMHDFLLENNVDATIIPITTHVDALRLLSSGKHDYAIVANLPGLYLGKELGLTNLVVAGKPFSARGYTYAVKKGNEGVLTQFTEGLAILKNTGRQQQIYDKWLGSLEAKNTLPWQTFGLVTGAVSLILLVITGTVTIWNRSLKIQVDKRTVELHEHQQQLIQADKMSSLGVLVSGVAHEINNPTSLLLLNLPLLNDTWVDAQKILELYYQDNPDFQLAGLHYSRIRDELPLIIDEMNNGAYRIKRIVEDLKDFARYDPEEHNELLDINNVVQTSIRLVENSLRKSTDNFTVEYGKDIPKILINAQRIEQVVVNLLLNACQSLKSRDKAVTLKTMFEPSENMLTIRVEDQGCGIDEKNIHRLIDPFFTTKREDGGTGLGLSVSSSIAKSHNGSLSFSSQMNLGTIATLNLPIRESVSE